MQRQPVSRQTSSSRSFSRITTSLARSPSRTSFSYLILPSNSRKTPKPATRSQPGDDAARRIPDLVLRLWHGQALLVAAPIGARLSDGLDSAIRQSEHDLDSEGVGPGLHVRRTAHSTLRSWSVRLEHVVGHTQSGLGAAEMVASRVIRAGFITGTPLTTCEVARAKSPACWSTSAAFRPDRPSVRVVCTSDRSNPQRGVVLRQSGGMRENERCPCLLQDCPPPKAEPTSGVQSCPRVRSCVGAVTNLGELPIAHQPGDRSIVVAELRRAPCGDDGPVAGSLLGGSST